MGPISTDFRIGHPDNARSSSVGLPAVEEDFWSSDLCGFSTNSLHASPMPAQRRSQPMVLKWPKREPLFHFAIGSDPCDVAHRRTLYFGTSLSGARGVCACPQSRPPSRRGPVLLPLPYARHIAPKAQPSPRPVALHARAARLGFRQAPKGREPFAGQRLVCQLDGSGRLGQPRDRAVARCSSLRCQSELRRHHAA
jgi:hypothetical protein